MPYFREIHNDLALRSDRKQKGVNRITFIDYTRLPCLIAERLFAVFDVSNTSYISQTEFINGMMQLYSGTFADKIRLVFMIYDFDKDQKIATDDVIPIITSMPVQGSIRVHPEGKFTSEGGGA